MDLIQEYLGLTKICAFTDYSDKTSVKRHNKSVKRMYEIIKNFNSEQIPETIDDFLKLLDIDDNKTNVWTAIHTLENFIIDDRIEEKALKIIKKEAEEDTVNSIGYKIWLENYKRK